MALRRLVDARILTITDGAPFLTEAETSRRIDFFEGGGAYMLLSHDLVRVNARGIRILRESNLMSDNMLYHHWQHELCNISAFAMCQRPSGATFPFSAPLVGVGNTWGVTACANGQGKMMNALDTASYDVSSCDILDESLDMVYTQGHVYYRLNRMSFVWYWGLILGCIYLIRSVSLNIISKFKESVPPTQHIILCVNVVIWILISIDGDVYYVTENDRFFYWVTQVYIMLYILFHAYHATIRFWRATYMEPRVFNLSIASLQLVTTRLYGSAETPYVIVIVGLMASRIWEKQIVHKTSFVVTGLFDCMYLTLLVALGFTYELYFLCPLFIFSRNIAGNLAQANQQFHFGQ
jgi:hypothetical protein